MCTGVFAKSCGVFVRQVNVVVRSTPFNALFLSGKPIAISLAASVHELMTASVGCTVVPAYQRPLTWAGISSKTAHVWTDGTKRVEKLKDCSQDQIKL